MSEENPNAFKLWINAEVVKKYFNELEVSDGEIQKIIADLQPLELRARVQLIARALKAALPTDYPSALKSLIRLTRKKNMKSFELWPATEFIQLYGLDHVQESLEAMYHFTSDFTAEFSIRPFINKHGEDIYQRLHVWKNDPNEHIRRWLSEGTRPRLPWGEKLHRAVKNPGLGLEILEHLKFDTSLYVRKSVSNHLNDIAKDHPDLVVKTLTRWKTILPPNYQKEFQFIANRALRTLIKEGHRGALRFMGIDSEGKNLRISPPKLDKRKIKLGQKIELSFRIKNTSQKNVKYVVDYVVYFKKSNGGLSPKVFKLKTGILGAGQTLYVKKALHIKPITTRMFFSGRHQVAVKLNGIETKPVHFELSVPTKQ
ncbi:MAG: DNA alkylation repair protein [Bdellovibrionales bacterium]|nr:DNA alkylation repair protein [Bdellovibrionales bacterium]